MPSLKLKLCLLFIFIRVFQCASGMKHTYTFFLHLMHMINIILMPDQRVPNLLSLVKDYIYSGNCPFCIQRETFCMDYIQVFLPENAQFGHNMKPRNKLWFVCDINTQLTVTEILVCLDKCWFLSFFFVAWEGAARE